MQTNESTLEQEIAQLCTYKENSTVSYGDPGYVLDKENKKYDVTLPLLYAIPIKMRKTYRRTVDESLESASLFDSYALCAKAGEARIRYMEKANINAMTLEEAIGGTTRPSHDFQYGQTVLTRDGSPLSQDSYLSLEEYFEKLSALYNGDLPHYMTRVLSVSTPDGFPSKLVSTRSSDSKFLFPKGLGNTGSRYGTYNDQQKLLPVAAAGFNRNYGYGYEVIPIDNNLILEGVTSQTAMVTSVPFIKASILEKDNFELYQERILKELNQFGQLLFFDNYSIHWAELPVKKRLKDEDNGVFSVLLKKKTIKKKSVKTLDAETKKIRAEKRELTQLLKNIRVGAIPTEYFKTLDRLISQAIYSIINGYNYTTYGRTRRGRREWQISYSGKFSMSSRSNIAYRFRGSTVNLKFFHSNLDSRFTTFYNNDELPDEVYNAIKSLLRSNAEYYKCLYQFKPYLAGLYRYINSPLAEKHLNEMFGANSTTTSSSVKSKVCDFVALLSKEIRLLHLVGDGSNDPRTKRAR